MAVGMLMPTSPSRMCPRGGMAAGPARCVHSIGDPRRRLAFARLTIYGGSLWGDARAALNCPPVAPAQPGGPGGWRGPGRPGRQAGHAASAVQRAVVAHPVSLPQFADAHTHQLPAAELRDQRADAGARGAYGVKRKAKDKKLLVAAKIAT